MDQSGSVATHGNGAPLTFDLAASASISYHCSSSPGVSSSYCAVVNSIDPIEQVNGTSVQVPQVTYTLLVRNPSASIYALRIEGPQNGVSSIAYPLSAPGAGGFRRSDVGCVPDQGMGTYQITWSLGGAILATLDYPAPAASPNVVPCTSTPFGRGVPADLTQQQSSTHFLVHYTTDPLLADHTTDQAVAALLTTAEGAYSYDIGTLGMPSYVDDGDGKVDIYIENGISSNGFIYIAPAAGQSKVPTVGYPSASYVAVRPSAVSNSFDLAFDVFIVLANAIGRTGKLESPALRDSAGNWAASNYVQQSIITPTLGQPLDCNLTCPGHAAYAHWRFYQHLAERFGPTVVRDLLASEAMLLRQNPQTPAMDQALQDVIGAHGSSLLTELAGYGLEDLSGAWQAPWVVGYFSDGASYTAVSLNPAGASASYSVSVRHLADHYLRLTVGFMEPCVTDTLTLDTTVPAGGAAPGAAVGGTYAVPATALSGTAQRAQVTFDSCLGVTVRLPLVNGTINVDQLVFSVNATLVRGP